MRLISVFYFFVIPTFCFSQVPITWKTLEDVTFKEKYQQAEDTYYWYPTFGASIQNLVGKEVSIKGYVIPIDIDAGQYVLSAFPFANCFFCGGAGPQTVLELVFVKKPRRYNTDERLSFKGKLKTNADDIYRMNYILEDAEPFEEKK